MTEPAGQMTKVIKPGRLIDGTGNEPLTGKAITITGGSIATVVDEESVASDATVEEIDLSDCTVLPGLIDCHLHPTFNGEPNYLELVYTKSIPYRTLMGQANGMKDLLAGFTTVRALGEKSQVDIALREAVRNGLIQGPRIVAAGQSISVTGGHGDLWLAPGFSFEEGLSGMVVDGPDQFRKAARTQLKAGADVIKLLLSGGLMSAGGDPGMRYMTPEEIKAAADEAHLWGKKLSAHSHGHESSRVGIENGVDTLEHGVFLSKDPELFDIMAERNIFFVPTLSVIVPPIGNANAMPEFFLRKKREAEEYALKTFEMALRAGVRIASGSDIGGAGAYHGNNALELELMVKAGMSCMDAIVSATKTASDCCGVERVTGTIEPGKSADIIAVKGDPLSDISVLRNVRFVMKEGNVVKHLQD